MYVEVEAFSALDPKGFYKLRDGFKQGCKKRVLVDVDDVYGAIAGRRDGIACSSFPICIAAVKTWRAQKVRPGQIADGLFVDDREESGAGELQAPELGEARLFRDGQGLEAAILRRQCCEPCTLACFSACCFCLRPCSFFVARAGLPCAFWHPGFFS